MASFDITVGDVYCPYLLGTASWSASMENRGSLSFSVLQSKMDVQVGNTIGAFTHGVRIFGGKVKERRARRAAGSSSELILDIDVASWEQRLEYRFVKAIAYGGMTAGQVLTALYGAYAVGDLHLGTIDPGADAEELGRIIFRGVSVAEAFTDLASRSAYTWWVDPDGFIQFRDREDIPEVTLVISPSNVNYREPEVRETSDDYFNRANAETEWDAVTPEVASFRGDGSTTSFEIEDQSGNPILVDHVVSILLNSVEQAIGVKDRDTDKSFYWQEGTNVITQDLAVPTLTAADQLAVKFHRLGANVTTVQDSADVAARAAVEFNSGVYEAWIGDVQDINSTGTFNRATAFLDNHVPARITRIPPISAGTMPREYMIECDTYLPGMEDVRPGVVINISTSVPATDTRGLVASVSASDVGTPVEDPVSGGPTKSFLRVKITFSEYRPLADSVEFYKALAEVNRGGGGTSTFNSGVSQSPGSRLLFYEVGRGIVQTPGNDITSRPHFCQDGLALVVIANQKSWPIPSDTQFDIKWSTNGVAWASIFSGATPVIPYGIIRAQFFGGLVNDPMKVGYLTRFDLLSGSAMGLFVTLEYGPPTGPAGQLNLAKPAPPQGGGGPAPGPPDDWGQFPIIL